MYTKHNDISFECTNVTLLLRSEWPLVPDTSIILCISWMDPSWTCDALHRCAALKARIFQFRITPMLPIKLLAGRMKYHVIRWGVTLHVKAPEHVQAPRPPILQVRVGEHPAINDAFTRISGANSDVCERQHHRGLVKGVSILPERLLQRSPELHVVHVYVFDEPRQCGYDNGVDGINTSKREDKVEYITDWYICSI